MLLVSLVGCHAFAPGGASIHRPRARSLATRMKTNPGDRWESFVAARQASEAFRMTPSASSAFALCQLAATNQDADAEAVCEALLLVEKEQRAKAKDWPLPMRCPP